MKNENQSRNSNIELLRIICMLLLVAHHFSYHGKLYLSTNSFIRTFSLLFCPLGKICYVIFIVISCYFLVDAKWKSKRFFKIWLEVLFYNIILDLIIVIINGFNGIETIRMFAGGLFPMIGNSHGFASSYLSFIVVLPILKIIQDNINFKQQKYFVVILAIIQIGSWILEMISGFNAGIKSELLLFTFMYFLIYYLKNKDIIHNFIAKKSNYYVALFMIFLIYGFEYIVWYLSVKYNNIMVQYLHNFISNQCSPLNIISAFLVVLLVILIPVNNNKIINKLATGTFGVLLIHDHNYFRQLLWDNIVMKTKILYSNGFVFMLKFIIIVVMIYVICSIIDIFRQYFECHLLEKSKMIRLMNRIDSYLQ